MKDSAIKIIAKTKYNGAPVFKTEVDIYIKENKRVGAAEGSVDCDPVHFGSDPDSTITIRIRRDESMYKPICS
jgi:hypothetical protein